MVTIPTSTRKITYAPVASTGPFPVTFPVFDELGSDLTVTLDGVVVTGWTFAGSLESGFYGEPNTWINGNVTFTDAQTGTLVIKGKRAPRRVAQYAEGRGIPARDHNTEYNLLTAVDQELRRDIDEGLATIDGIDAAAIAALAAQVAVDAASALASANSAASLNPTLADWYLTRTAAAASTIPAAVKRIETGFYNVVGDLGGTKYHRITTSGGVAPTHAAWFRSADRYTASGSIDAANGGYWEITNRRLLHVEMFGAVQGTGVGGTVATANTTAINGALRSTASNGGVVEMTGVVEHNDVLYIGNGTSGAVPSTIYGVQFRGTVAGNAHSGQNAVFPAGAQLKWVGSSGVGYQLRVLGPLAGFGIENIDFNSANLCNYGVDIVAGHDGVLRNVTVTQARVIGLSFTGLPYYGATGLGSPPGQPASIVETGCSKIFCYNIEVLCGDVANATGVSFDGSAVRTLAEGDSEGNTFSLQMFNLRVASSLTHDSIGIARRVCDSIKIDGYLYLYRSVRVGHYAVYDDYNKHPGYPYGCTIDGFDTAGAAGVPMPEAQQIINLGSPNQSYSSNKIGFIPNANGTINPRLIGNIDVDLPVKNAPDVYIANQSAATSGTSFTSKSIGMPAKAMYRVNYYMTLRASNAGWTGNITFTTGFDDGTGKGIVSAPLAVNVANAFVQGSDVIMITSGTAVGWSVSFNGISGSPVYDLLVTYEKLN